LNYQKRNKKRSGSRKVFAFCKSELTEPNALAVGDQQDSRDMQIHAGW
jgi:hypothetical protein